MKSKLLKLTLTIVIYFLSLGFSYSNENQSKFISIIDEYKNKYSPNSNELKTNKLLIDRDNKLCDEISLSVNNWIGKIKSIDTNMEGKGILAVIIDKGIFSVFCTCNKFFKFYVIHLVYFQKIFVNQNTTIIYL